MYYLVKFLSSTLRYDINDCENKAMTKITVNMEEEEEPLPEIYIPKVPNKILMAQYISRDVIWLLMAGFDAGYIYEYPSPEVSETIVEKPVKSTIIYDADDIEIRSCLF